MKRPALWIAAVVTLQALLVGGGGVPIVHAQKPLVKLTAAMGSQGILWTAYYVAVDQGFFAQEGLEVEHLNAPAANTLTAVISGNAHVAAATVHLITGRSKGEAIKAFVPLQEQFATAMVLSRAAIEKSGIKSGMSVEDKMRRLRGLRIGITSPGSTIDLLLRNLAVSAGLKPDQDIKLVPFGSEGVPMLAALERGAIDGFMYVPPWPEEAVDRGLGEMVLNPHAGEVKELQGVSYLAYYGREEWLRSKPDEVARFTRAIGKALRHIHQNPESAIDSVHKRVPQTKRAVLATAFKSYAKSIPKDTRVSRDSMDKALWLFNLGKPADKQVKLRYEDLVAPEFGEQAARELGL